MQRFLTLDLIESHVHQHDWTIIYEVIYIEYILINRAICFIFQNMTALDYGGVPPLYCSKVAAKCNLVDEIPTEFKRAQYGLLYGPNFNILPWLVSPPYRR